MSATYKRQDHFAHDLAMAWPATPDQVRYRIRTLKNKAQTAYISARVMSQLITMDDQDGTSHAQGFLKYMHPDNKESLI